MRYLFLSLLLAVATVHADPVPDALDPLSVPVLEVNGSEPLSEVVTQLQNHFAIPPGDQALILFCTCDELTNQPHYFGLPNDSLSDAVAADDVVSEDLAAEALCALNPRSSSQFRTLQDVPPQRNYNQPVSPTEKSTIAYIINLLGEGNYAKLLLKKGELERKGAEIDHLHPLRHLATIFTDEQLKVNFRNMKKHSKIFNNYASDMGKTFGQEAANNNLIPHVNDFAKTVQVDANTVASFMQQQRWKDFLEWLADAVPRQGNARRYDM